VFSSGFRFWRPKLAFAVSAPERRSVDLAGPPSNTVFKRGFERGLLTAETLLAFSPQPTILTGARPLGGRYRKPVAGQLRRGGDE